METTVYTADSKLQAEMLVEILKNEGIAARYVNNAGTQIFEHRRGDVNQPQTILVDERDVAQARLVIEVYTMNAEEAQDDPAEYANSEYYKMNESTWYIFVVILIFLVGFCVFGVLWLNR